jgi:hypothetical protein
VTHRNLAILAALFPEAQNAVITQIAILRHPQFRHSADSGAGVGQYAEHGAIA